MNKPLEVLGGIGLGAGLMYFFDPQAGNRRRALLRDKTKHLVRESGWQASRVSRDLGNRAQGLAAAARSPFAAHDNSDAKVAGRVRSAIGRASSHPGAIGIQVDEGRVILSGAVLAADAPRVVDTVKSVEGVRDVDNRMAIHETAANIPSLQGEGHRPRSASSGWLRRRWPPAMRFLSGTAGGALLALGVRRGGSPGAILGAFGAGLLGCGITGRHSAWCGREDTPAGSMRAG